MTKTIQRTFKQYPEAPHPYNPFNEATFDPQMLLQIFSALKKHPEERSDLIDSLNTSESSDKVLASAREHAYVSPSVHLDILLYFAGFRSDELSCPVLWYPKDCKAGSKSARLDPVRGEACQPQYGFPKFKRAAKLGEEIIMLHPDGASEKIEVLKGASLDYYRTFWNEMFHPHSCDGCVSEYL